VFVIVSLKVYTATRVELISSANIRIGCSRLILWHSIVATLWLYCDILLWLLWPWYCGWYWEVYTPFHYSSW